MSQLVGIRPPVQTRLVSSGAPLIAVPATDVPAPTVVSSFEKQSMTLIIVLALLLLGVMMTTPEQMYHENCMVRLVATHKNAIAAALAILILIVVLRVRKIGDEMTRWVPFLPERYAPNPFLCGDRCDCSRPESCASPDCCDDRPPVKLEGFSTNPQGVKL